MACCGPLRALAAGNSADFGAFDDDVFFRHVLMETGVTGGDILDLVDHFGAFDHLAEDAVAPAAAVGRLEVEEGVVGDVDEELRRGRMRIVGTRHGDGIGVVLQAVVGLVLDRCLAGLLRHARLETAALDHKARDNAVEYRVVVMAGFGVGDEILDRFRRLFGIEFKSNDAEIGV